MSDRPFRLVQISDLHLPPALQGDYRGVDVHAQLATVLAHIGEHYPHSDRLLVTGDNTHGGGAEDYRGLIRLLDRQFISWSWIPGNHDQVEMMERLRPASANLFAIPGWQLLLLDSTAEPDGCGAGALTEDSLALLDAATKNSLPALVVLHHNPMPVQSLWQDAIGLKHAARFWSSAKHLARRSTALCGHVHQVWEVEHHGLRVLSCPSTAVQFKPGCERLSLECEGDAALPGYRWLDLYPDGRLRTGIERVRLA